MKNEALPDIDISSLVELPNSEGCVERALVIAREILKLLEEQQSTLAVAESLTGGKLANAFVTVPGASSVFRGGAVTYATDTKASLLSVDIDVLGSRGAVDPLVAMEMAEGVSSLFGADYALTTTGVAGPGPSEGKPAGTVFIGVKTPDSTHFWGGRISGSREDVRNVTVEVGLMALLAEIRGIIKP
ncbi:CinA family protein [Arcanobacterium ihumii]|uniref:CinA family protein n=1 Tax=Arcanobacterium ihumii TaxID=2138162 RepID=UPI00190FB4C3|nr:CinA family protein [Arcanobacterium ihumii]